jgi:hypothetical protein
VTVISPKGAWVIRDTSNSEETQLGQHLILARLSCMALSGLACEGPGIVFYFADGRHSLAILRMYDEYNLKITEFRIFVMAAKAACGHKSTMPSKLRCSYPAPLRPDFLGELSRLVFQKVD